MNKRALILFAHGARDPRWAMPFERLQKIVQAQRPDIVVSLAFLEFMTPSLPNLVNGLVSEGYADVTLVPIFLGQGGHVLRDLPVIIDGLRAEHPSLSICIAEAVGENEAVLNAIAAYCISQIFS